MGLFLLFSSLGVHPFWILFNSSFASSPIAITVTTIVPIALTILLAVSPATLATWSDSTTVAVLVGSLIATPPALELVASTTAGAARWIIGVVQLSIFTRFLAVSITIPSKAPVKVILAQAFATLDVGPPFSFLSYGASTIGIASLFPATVGVTITRPSLVALTREAVA